jgi:hypothetical protein
MYIHYSCRIHVELKDGSRDPERIRNMDLKPFGLFVEAKQKAVFKN